MARQARLVVPNIVHHVVARGVNRTRLFTSGFDKGRYLKRAARIADQEQVQIHGYCLLHNHVHFLLTPASACALGRFFSRLHTWWAMAFNQKHNRSGHLFQGRYFSSPLSECHYWTALRYVELNPVRARLVKHAQDWLWSSARAHLYPHQRPFIPLPTLPTRARNTAADWQQLLQTDSPAADDQLRRAARSCRPCGPPAFLLLLQQTFHRRLLPASAKSLPCHLPS